MDARPLLVALAAALLLAPVASAAPPEATGTCTGDPDLVAACGCPQGFWGVTLVALGEERSFVCFF